MLLLCTFLLHLLIEYLWTAFFANKEENTKQNDLKDAIAIHQKMYFSPSSNNRIFANSMARKPVFV